MAATLPSNWLPRNLDAIARAGTAGTSVSGKWDRVRQGETAEVGLIKTVQPALPPQRDRRPVSEPPNCAPCAIILPRKLKGLIMASTPSGIWGMSDTID
jgi:hypothetical protein